MKTYRSPRELLAAIDQALAKKPIPKLRTSPLEEAVRLLHQGRHYLWTSVYLIRGDELVRTASAGPQTSCERMPLREGVVGRAAHSGEIQLIPDVAAEPAYRAVLPHTRSECAVPIRIAAHILGVLNVEHTEPAAFGSEDRVLIKNVAARLARFLTGKGKHIMRGTAGPVSANQASALRQQPQSEVPKDLRAAVGAKSRT